MEKGERMVCIMLFKTLVNVLNKVNHLSFIFIRYKFIMKSIYICVNC